MERARLREEAMALELRDSAREVASLAAQLETAHAATATANAALERARTDAKAIDDEWRTETTRQKAAADAALQAETARRAQLAAESAEALAAARAAAGWVFSLCSV